MEISPIALSLPKSPITLFTCPPRPSFVSNRVFFSSKGQSLHSSSFVLRSNQRFRKRFVCNSLFGLGVPELVVIGAVAALLFGPKKLPEIGKSIGKTVKSFQQAAKEFESELKKEPDASSDTSDKPIPASTEQKKQDIEV